MPHFFVSMINYKYPIPLPSHHFLPNSKLPPLSPRFPPTATFSLPCRHGSPENCGVLSYLGWNFQLFWLIKLQNHLHSNFPGFFSSFLYLRLALLFGLVGISNKSPTFFLGAFFRDSWRRDRSSRSAWRCNKASKNSQKRKRAAEMPEGMTEPAEVSEGVRDEPPEFFAWCCERKGGGKIPYWGQGLWCEISWRLRHTYHLVITGRYGQWVLNTCYCRITNFSGFQQLSRID